MNPLHTIDGFLPSFELFGTQIPTYYPVISFSFCVCLIWLIRRARKFQFDERLVIDSGLLVMFASFIGARVFHVLFEDFQFYQEHPLDIFKFWNGGFGFYGGAIRTFFSGFIFLKYHRQKIGDWLNLYAPISALGYGLGRIACLVTGCCFGGICEIHGFEFRHPTQLYAVLLEFGIVVVLLKIESTPRLFQKLKTLEGYLFCIWIFLHSTARLFMEYFRVDPRGPMPLGISISSWISLFIMLSDAIYILSRLKKFQSFRTHSIK